MLEPIQVRVRVRARARVRVRVRAQAEVGVQGHLRIVVVRGELLVLAQLVAHLGARVRAGVRVQL